MTAYEQAQHEKKRIMTEALLVASAVIAALGKREDEISEREAFETYGRAWVRDRTKRGMLTVVRHGSTIRSAKVYSRFEIESLKRAEKKITDEFEATNELTEQIKEELLK